MTRPERDAGGWCRWRSASAVTLMVAALAAGGCVSAVLAPKIVTAPNASAAKRPSLAQTHPEARVALAQLYTATLRVPVPGPPAAEIALGVIEPGDYQHEYALVAHGAKAAKPEYYVDTRWQVPAADALRPAPKGTIVVLHGFWLSREAVLHWAIHLAEAGYRTVAVDLRGHGASTGPWVTYGALETADLSVVLDVLQHRGLAGERVGVLGISYGASIGLLWAARDARVGPVVALEPYANPREAIGQYARARLAPAVSRTITDEAVAAATRRAAKLAGFSWDAADVLREIGQVREPILFIHGAADTVIPPGNSRRLYAAAPAGSRLIETPADDHFSLSLRLGGVAAEVVAWFDAAIARETAR